MKKVLINIWEERISYLFISPALITFLLFFVYPFFYSLYLSFTNSQLIGPPPSFIGLDNFKRIIGDDLFWTAMSNTVWLAIVTTFLTAAVSLLVAFLLSKKIKFTHGFRTLLYIPVITPIVAVTRIWEYIYSPTPGGLLNYLLGFIGISPQGWLGDTQLALISVALMMVWQGLGWDMIIFLAGLKGIPQIFYEAATIDGANGWQKFRHITIPLLKPVLIFVIIIGTINGFKIFGQVLLLTNGGPMYATTTVVLQIYKKAFQNFEMGYAAALSLGLAALILVVTLLQRKLFGDGSDLSYE